MRYALLTLAMSTLAFASPSRVTDDCLDCSVETNLLWPPNHVMVDVGLLASTTSSTTIEVYSDEANVWPASAHFSPDASQSSPVLRLRSEREGSGDGRVYLIIVSDTNTGDTCFLTVGVPHSLSRASIASLWAQTQAAEDYWTEHEAAPPEFFLLGTSPVSGSKQ